MPIGYRVDRMLLCGRNRCCDVAPFRISTCPEEKERIYYAPLGAIGRLPGDWRQGPWTRMHAAGAQSPLRSSATYSNGTISSSTVISPRPSPRCYSRPVGASIIGWIGDKRVRKPALILTIAMMASCTALVGLIPSYASIVVLAPIILVLARLMQGFSVGGEWGNSTAFMVEWAPEGRRGFYSSFQQCSLVAGLLLGSGIAALLNTVLATDTMQAWGWRIPFLIGSMVALVGIYMRRNVEDSPIYRRVASGQAASGARSLPIVETAQAFGFMIVWAVQFYIFLAYMPTFTQKYAGLGSAAALWSNTAGLLLLMVAIPP